MRRDETSFGSGRGDDMSEEEWDRDLLARFVRGARCPLGDN